MPLIPAEKNWKYFIKKQITYGNSDDVEGLGSSVIGAVHNGSDWEGQRDMEFSTSFSSASSLRHFISRSEFWIKKSFK